MRTIRTTDPAALAGIDFTGLSGGLLLNRVILRRRHRRAPSRMTRPWIT